MTAPPNHVYEFGDCRLDPAERLLLRGGRPVSLTPKVFDTLQVLVRGGGHLVRKDDLMKEVWPDAVVEEANLARNIWTLRRALGGGDDGRDYIETIPKVGYRFVAAIRLVPAEPALAAPLNGSFVASPVAAAEAPQPVVPVELPRATPTRRPQVGVAWTLAIVGLGVVGLAAFWWAPLPSERAGGAGPDIRMLTDGHQADNAASWTHDGKIHFSRMVSDTRLETWRMEADGSNPRRANSEIPSLLHGKWSPDGRKVVFSKDDSPGVLYLADADGRNEVQLAIVPGNLDWAPDGSRFVYQSRRADGASDLSVYVAATGASTLLSSHQAGDADPSFSPDGTLVAFTSWRDGNAEIYVMRADGSQVRRMTNHPAFDNFPVFSPDGTQLAFQSNREDEHFEIYLLNVAGDAPPVRLTRSQTRTGFAPRSWSRDGTEMLVYTNRNGKDQVGVVKVNPHPARLLVGDPEADLSFPRATADGRQLVYEARLSDRSLELRVTNLQTARTRRVFRTEPGLSLEAHLAPAWSPDQRLIAFSAKSDGNSEILTINADGTGLQNLTRNPLLDTTPVFSADGREIFFARDEFGRAQLYRMNLDGQHQRRVMDSPGYEMNPAVSRDGRFLAFAGDRHSRGLDILLLDLSRPGNETVLAARSSHDALPAFSPDGRHVAFMASSDGNPEIYVAALSGGAVRLTRHPAEDEAPHFMPDGRRLLFGSSRSGRFAIYEIDLDLR